MQSRTVTAWSIATLMVVVFVTLVPMNYSRANALETTDVSKGRLAYAPRVYVSFYPVEGKTKEELTSSMLERGPIGHGNKRFFAYTYWHLKLYSRNSRQALKCRVSVLLPFLRPNPHRSQKAKESWNSFYASIVAHESNHIRMAIHTCRQLKRANLTKARLEVASQRLKKRDREYDFHSKHGILEGVRLS